MPALLEDGQRFGKADGQWTGDGLVIPPNDGVPGSILHRQVFKAPLPSNVAGFATIAVNVQPGGEIQVPFKLVPDGTSRVAEVTFTPAPPGGSSLEIHGVSGYGMEESETRAISAAFVFGKLAYTHVTKLVWRGVAPYVGTVDIGWSTQMGLRFPLISAQDVLLEEYQENDGAVPFPVTSSSIEITYDLSATGQSGARGLWNPISPSKNGVRNFTILYRPAKVDTVEAVPNASADAPAVVFQHDYEYGGN